MKKLLLNGTAIAGLALAMTATPAAADLELGIGGHFSAYGVFASQDEAAEDTHDFELQREAELYFMGETTLDNGLTVGAEIQVEGESNAGAAGQGMVDESYIYMSGDWGRVNVGSENGAAYLLQVGAPAVDANFDGIDPEYIVVNRGGNAALAANGRGFNYGMGFGGDNDRGDTNKLTYLSPVFSGFQVGVSYSSTLQEDVDVRDGLSSDAAAAGLEDEYQVGARWAGQFEGVGVTLGAGWAQAEQEVETAGEDDREQWNVGLNLNFSNVTVGGAYFEDNNGLDSDAETKTYVLGANYETGPYTFGVSWLDTETEVGVDAEDEASRILVGGSYAYGPGMTFNGAVHFYELEDDASVALDENDATIVTLGTVVKF